MLQGDFDQPLSAAAAMVGFRRPWALCGGWAIDLFVGEVTRQHSGVGIAVLRDHQIELRDYLHDWTFKIRTLDNRLVPWKHNRQMLMLPVRELQATDRIGRHVELMLNESDGIDWIFPGNFEVRMNLSQWVIRTRANVPVLCPQIVLLYKSQRLTYADELDLRVALPRMSDDQRTWLKLALMRCDPSHAWLDVL